MYLARAAWCVAVLALATAGFAQEAPLVTDRPDFTESSEVVGRKNLQFETGFSYESEDEQGIVTAPSSLARYGLNDRVELRLSTDGYVSTGHGVTKADGFADLEVGAKVRLLYADKAGIDVSIIPMVSLPTGQDEISAGHPDPTVKFTWARDLPSGFGLSGNYNISSLSEGDARFTQQALSVSLGHDLPKGLGSYIEFFGFSPMQRGGDAGWILDGGVSRQFAGRLQFDIEAGRGLTAAAPDWFVGFGFAIRGHLGGR